MEDKIVSEEEREITFLPAAPPDDLTKLVDSIKVEIVKLRGFKAEDKIKKEIKSKAEVKKYIFNYIKDSRQDLINEGKVLIKLGLLPSYVSYPEMLAQIFINVSGYYDPKEKVVFIAEGISKEQQEFVLAHEITHFFQDKVVDLNSFGKNKNNSDEAIAYASVIEGEAFALAIDYLLREKNIEFTALTDLFTSYLMYMGFSGDLNAISSLYIFPYIQGLSFLREIRLVYPWTYMKEVYKNPPSSSEQIIHPEKYIKEKDEPVSIKLSDVSALLGSSWKKIYENTLGELIYSLILQGSGDLVGSTLGSEGWDGDRILCYESVDSGNIILIQLSTWDSFQDAKEFLWAYNEVIKNKYLEEETVDAKELNCLVWDTEDGIALIEIKDKNVLIIEGLPNYELCLKVRQSIWNDAEREGLITTKEIPNLEKLKLTAEDFYRKGKELFEEWVPLGATPYFLSRAEFYLMKAIELDESFLEAYPLLARVTVATSYLGKDFNEGETRQAFYYIDKAEKINPDFAQLYWAKAHAYRALKRDEVALAEINKAITQHPNNPEYHISLGMIYNYGEQKNYPKAIEIFNKALSLKPTKAQEARIYVYLKDAYDGLSKHEEQVENIKKFLDLGYISSEALDGLAYSLGKLGRYDEAIEVQKKSLRYKESPKAHTRLGALYTWKEMYEEAEKEYLHANDKEYLENLVNRYRTKGWFDKADKLISKMKKEDMPLMLQRVEAYVSKGILDYEQGNLEGAISNYEKALEIDPTYSPIFVYLAEIYEIKGDKVKADGFYKKAEALDAKKSAQAYYHLGDIYANTKGKHLKAIQLFKKSIELDPEYAKAYYGLGRTHALYAYSHGKDYTDSVNAFKKALELGFINDAVYYGLGAAYYEWGKYNEAIPYFKKTLELKPEDPHAKRYLEESQRRIKR